MPITNRTLQPGTTLTAKFKGSVHQLVVSGDEENPTFEAPDGKTYKSLSAAGSAVMDGVACNGWRFWSVIGEEPGEAKPAATAEPRAKARKTAAAKTKPLFKQVRKVPNQNGLAEGDTRWFCSACMKGFVVSGGATPETCPEGHAREVVDDLDSSLAPVDASTD